MTYFDIRQQQMWNCKDLPKKYIICVESCKIVNYLYDTIEDNKKKGKICFYFSLRFANCIEAQTANFLYCILRHEIEISAWKEKKVKKI